MAGFEDKPIPKDNKAKDLRINREIRIDRVMVISEDSSPLGVMPTRQAYELAREKSLDLVEVSPNSNPPVCRIMDYGKYKFQQAKSTQKRKVQELREVKMRPKTDEHDFEIKTNTIRRLIEGGDRVKMGVRFRGREVTYAHLAMQMFERAYNSVQDIAIIVQKPVMDNRSMVMILAPKPSNVPKSADSQPAEATKAAPAKNVAPSQAE